MKTPSKEIIEKVLNNKASEQERESAIRWFKSNEGQLSLEENMDEFFDKIQPGFEDLYLNHEIASSEIYDKIEKKLFLKKNIGRFLLQIAAILLPLVLVLGFVFNANRSYDMFGTAAMTELYVPKGEQMKITLPDGSAVYLNSDTEFRYPTKFRYLNRKVELVRGEAYFIVSKDKKRPFSVDIENAQVKVLGTSFNINAYEKSDHITLSLDEGKIELISAANRSYSLCPQEQLLYDKKAKTATIQKLENTKSFSDWKEGIIAFRNAALREVIDVLNRQFNLDFEVKNPQAYEYSFTLTSENEPIENILDDLERISPLQFTRTENKIEVDIR